MIDEAEWQALWTRTADQAVLDERQRVTGSVPRQPVLAMGEK